MGKKGIVGGYCNTCKKEVKNPSKKPMEAMEKTIWAIIIISTLGFAAIPLLIYHYGLKKREYCPTCGLKLGDKKIEVEPQKKEVETPTKSTTTKTPKGRSPKKAATKTKEKETEVEEEPKEKKRIICDYCGADLSEYEEELRICPNCGVDL